MKELIDKLARGSIEYELPVLEVSVSEINKVLSSKKLYEDSFTVFTANDKELKGFVYSTNENIKILDRYFIGKEKKIRYSVDTEYINKGDSISCEINIVSNGGEIVVPVSIKIAPPSVVTSLGELNNLFHFANLVQANYDEALTVFKSKDFAHIFLEDDFYLMAMYEGLRLSTSPEIAMEEFLVSANKKKSIKISLSHTERKYEDLIETEGDTVVITKDCWGYTEIDVLVSGDFIKVSKNKLTSHDFAGSNYELSYIVDVDRLHKGNNYAMIEFVTKTQRERLVISVYNGVSHSFKDRKYKKSIIDIFNKYIDFRTHKIAMEQWADDTIGIIEDMRTVEDTSVFMKLLQAQIYISKGMDTDAAWLLELVEKEFYHMDGSEKDNRNIEMYCYYQYVRAIQKKDLEFTGKTVEKIKQIYETGHDSWRLLWILFYLDERYDKNVTIKLARIKEQFNKGMHSPLMYYEGMSILAEHPELLRVFDDFELHLLNFGIKKGMVTNQLAAQIAELALGVKRFNRILFGILAELYYLYETKLILTAMVSMLIRDNKTDSRYFFWYEEAVAEELKLTSLYEYFVYSMPADYTKPLPQMVLMYFAYSSGVADEKLALVYENIINHKIELESIYKSYQNQMERFTIRCIEKGIIDEHIAVVYEDVLKNVMVTSETSKKLPKILNTYLITCRQKNIREVMVIHKETSKVCRYPLVNGRAYVEIYTEDAAIVFIDFEGICYGKSVQYTMGKIMDMDEYLDLCFEISQDNDNLIMYMSDRYLRYRNNTNKSIAILKRLMSVENIRTEYKLYVEREIINYYGANYDVDAVDEYLSAVEGRDLGTKARIKLIELMIMRGMYSRAKEFMEIYGYSVIDPGRVLRCVSKLLEKEEFIEDSILVDMCFFAYRHGKYNDATLRYLSLHFNGSAKETYALWKACQAYDYSDRDLEENLIACILFMGAQSMHLGEVYDSYRKKGAGEKLRKAFLFAKAYDYFVKENIIDDSIFKYIEKDITVENSLNDICKLAYVKYCSQMKELNETECKICRDVVFEMSKKGKIFEFFKTFAKHFCLPVSIHDKSIVEYHTNPEKKVTIHYIIETGNYEEKNYEVREMKSVCNGIFVQDFVLFYGENIQYYITEESDGVKNITESNKLTLEDVGISGKNDRESRYAMLNNMLISFDMNEGNTLSEMAGEYMLMSKLGDALFIKK